jgi:phosphoribosylformylglycinamidine synthase
MELTGEYVAPETVLPAFPEPSDYNAFLKRMLARLNICSKEEIVRRYDHEVQSTSVVKPFTGVVNDGPSDAAVLKPLYSSNAGLAVSHGLCPRYGDIDAYAMVANAIDEGIRNAVAVGANPTYMAGLDNFCWAMGKTPEEERKYVGALVRANRALSTYCKAFGVPCISGKDSMRNEYHIGGTYVAIPPTMMFSVVGKLEDVRNAVTLDFKAVGDLIYVVGPTLLELGGSEYLDELGLDGGAVPMVDADAAKARYEAVHAAMLANLIQSCHDCSDGGLAVALAESCIAGRIGAAVDLRNVPVGEDVSRDDYLLFSESASRFVVSVTEANASEFEARLPAGTWARVGIVGGDQLRTTGLGGNAQLAVPVEDLASAWKNTLSREALWGGARRWQGRHKS